MTKLDGAPVVGMAEFRRLAEVHNWVEAEEIPTEPLILRDGSALQRARPGRLFVRDAHQNVVAVANRCQA